MNLPFDFERALAGLSKVTLRGGVVGKTTFAIVAVSAVIGIIVWPLHNLWLSAAALGAVFLLAFVFLWKLIDFADRHPQAALLEGAEFLVHEQLVHGSKSNPVISVDANEKMQLAPIEGPAANPEVARRPDQEPPAIEDHGGGK